MQRIGKTDRNDGKSRPIIIKFASYAAHNDVYRNKKKHRGKNFSITESLMIARVKALKVVQSKYTMTIVWTSDGPIFFKNNNKIVIKHYGDKLGSNETCLYICIYLGYYLYSYVYILRN